jgi:hypothetical protein
MRHGVLADPSLPLWTLRASALERVSSIGFCFFFGAHKNIPLTMTLLDSSAPRRRYAGGENALAILRAGNAVETNAMDEDAMDEDAAEETVAKELSRWQLHLQLTAKRRVRQ